MSSPLSVGDVATILTTIYQIYHDYRNIPERLRQILKEFEVAKEEVKTLNKILSSSRRHEYRTYPDTHALVSDLQAALEYFEKFEPLTSQGKVSMVTRVSRTVKAKWDWNVVERHLSTMNGHRGRMNDFKQTVLLQAAQDNIELQIKAIQLQMYHYGQQFPGNSLASRDHDDISSISSRHVSVLTRASKSLRIARDVVSVPRSSFSSPPLMLQSGRERRNSDNGTGTRSAEDDLKRMVASYLEQEELYHPDALDQTGILKLQKVAEMPAKFLHQQHTKAMPQLRGPATSDPASRLNRIQEDDGDLGSSTSTLRPDEARIPLRPSRSPDDSRSTVQFLGEITTARHATETSSISESWMEVLNNVSLDARSIGDISTIKSLPSAALGSQDYSIAETTLSDDDSDEIDDERFSVQDDILLYTPWTGPKPVPCRLTLVKSTGSICARSETTRSISFQHISNGNVSLAPASLLGVRPPSNLSVSPLVFNHAVLGGMGSFPRILHPNAEGKPTSSNTHPYTIEFYTHQFVSVEGHPELPRAVKGIAYQFKTKQDRDRVREMMFDRQLLAAAGILTIQFGEKLAFRPCGTQAATLWLGQSEGKRRFTITLQCTTTGRLDPDCAVEFIVLKAKNITKVREGEGKELELYITPVSTAQEISPTIAATDDGLISSNASSMSSKSRQSWSTASISSKSPSTRRFSNLSLSRRQSETDENGAVVRCYMKFTEGTQTLTDSKKKFLDVLRREVC